MTTEIKICGLTSHVGIDAAAAAGASHFGLVHFTKSPRHVALDAAFALRAYAPKAMKSVLLLVNADALLTQRAIEVVRPDIVQFHGTETPEWLDLVRRTMKVEVWKALGIRDAAALAGADRFIGAADRLLFDAPATALPGGTGTRFDWGLLTGYQAKMPWGLAGGLTPDNVGDALHATRAPMVDASSGLESAPGVKDVDKIAAFCQRVRSYDTD
jgi:phosphoribosylanthranilate isomerase